MTYVLGFRKISYRCLLIVLSFALGSIERTDALCGKPGLTPVCKLDVAKESYEVAEIVTYKCTDCYTSDKRERQCLRNGSWSGHIPVCHKIISLENIGRRWFVNSTRQANFTMDRNTTTCSGQMMNSGTIWEVVLIKYFQISFVKVIVPAHQEISIIVKIRNGDKLEKSCGEYFGKIESSRGFIIFRCESGGDRVHIIQQNKVVALCEVYLYSLPDQEDCLRPDSPFLAEGRKSVSVSDSIKTYVFNCKPSYELVGDHKVNCQGGIWNKSSAFCRKKEIIHQVSEPHCHSLPNVENGILRVNTTSINSTAYLKCQAGYKPQGADRVHCLSSGKWTLDVLTCEVIECERNPRVRHGKGVLISHSALWGFKLQIICDPGYIAIDSELRECDENATWGNLDICVEISCGAFISGASDAEKWVSLNGKSSIRVLVCENGYYIEGSPAVTQCLPNGSWSYTTAVCRKYPVNEGWSSEWTPGTLFMSAVAVGAGTAICIVCLFLSFLVVKKRRKSRTNTTVFHVGVRDSFLFTDGAKDQPPCKNTYEDAIELRHNSFSSTPRRPSIALPHLPIDTDPVYAQPFETIEAGKTANTADIYTAHIYSEPVDSHKVNLYNNVAETWLKSGAKKFGRKMSLPGRSSLTEDSMQAASPNNIAVCKPVFHSTNTNPVDSFTSYEKSDYDTEKHDKLELISNSIYSSANDGSFTSCKDVEHFQMIDNDIYQGDYFSNV